MYKLQALALLLFVPFYCFALPTDDEVKGILVVCGGGQAITFKGDVEAKLNLWKKRGGSAGGSASMTDLSALFSTIPQGQQVNPESYRAYTACVLDLIQKYLMQDTLPSKAERLNAYFDAGYHTTYIAQAASGWGYRDGGKTYLAIGEDPMQQDLESLLRIEKVLNLDRCDFTGKARRSATGYRCLSIYRSIAENDGDGLAVLEIGSKLGAIRFFATDKNEELFLANRRLLGKMLKELGFHELSASIPNYNDDMGEYVNSFIPTFKSLVRSSY